ncbi:helix-turn-helix domain-containing protein [Amycolatopsis umgeniensis]|uniref:AraC-like DNA-binding protein n=1 Tax=Amycolatopsis umgeniensis TaxID=336628 RepID=A0A841AQV0_9PSEU|nr:helix-turn-helix transcriptional regulator [Amycolatopsis umgeniensis]MBB5850266.1 AraC-like DNA-binding protein [Amycolatopsis umgeniensis]
MSSTSDFAPPVDLADRVSQVWRRSGELPPALPQPSVDLLVFGDGSLWLSGPETEARTGSLTEPLTGLRLRPGTCASVLGIAADEVPLTGMSFPGKGLDAALRALRAPARPADRAVSQVLQAMRAAPGAPVSHHAAAVGLSERQLRRRFLVAVGLSPKAYTRVVRLHRAMALARSSSAPDWSEIAVRSGFYDQPHMIAEFRRAVGSSCVRFFQAAAVGG